MGTLLKSKNKGMEKIILSIIMFFVGISMVIPFVFMISAAFKIPGTTFVNPLDIIPDKSTLKNFQYIFHHNYFFIWYLNSFKVVFVTIILRLFLVTIAAYAFARLRFRGKEIIFIIFLSTMMITPDTTVVPRYLLFKYIGILDTHWAVILPRVFNVFFLFLFRQFFMQVPKELTEAGLIDGCSHFEIYYKIILPLVKPAVITTILFTFIWQWNNYAEPYVFITSINKQLITVGLEYFQGEAGANYTLQMAGASIAVIPTIIMFIISQKYFVKGISRSGIKG